MKKELKKGESRWYIYLPIPIIPFLAIFLYFFITDGALAKHAIDFVVGGNSTQVMYETFDVYIGELVKEEYRERVSTDLMKIKFNGVSRFNIVENKQSADVSIDYGIGEYTLFSEYLLPVGHMYWIDDSISSKELIGGRFSTLISILAYEEYEGFLTSFYPEISLEVVESMIESIEGGEGNHIGLIKPEELSKELKLLKVEGKYYLDTFDSGLPVSLTIESKQYNLAFIASIIQKNVNIDSNGFGVDGIAKVNMTGVTALTRRLGQVMDQKKDYDYPAELIGEFLADADLTHVSSETSFVEGCTSYSGMKFCSRPEYIETLFASGVDVVELTGNHNNDFGSKYNTETINTYIEEDIAYFGGGLDAEDSAKPYVVEIDGSKIAFLGYNYFDSVLGTSAIANTSRAGANFYSESKMQENIEEIRDEVDVVIVDFQFSECYSYPPSDEIYPLCYKPVYRQASTFRKAIDYGADIVVGTQAHQPQTYELYGDGVIFYGLGNLYFDQTPWIGTRQGMVLTHYFKEGELIQTKITPTIFDSALQVNIADEEDATLLLELLETARESL
ncbi:CapA family protein [bacterium]|nr:CapA family protein [bacterium]